MKLRASLLSVTAALAALSLGLGGLAPAAAAPGSSSSASDPVAEAVPETAPRPRLQPGRSRPPCGAG